MNKAASRADRTLAVLGSGDSFAARAIKDGGGLLTEDPRQAEGLVLDYTSSPGQLLETLRASGNVRWVQLPSAGIEAYAESLALRPDVTWTSAKGAYAAPVAEHALALTLALLRQLPERVRARSWGKPAGTSLHGLRAVVVGAGGVGKETVRLLKAFDTHVTVVRRTAGEVTGADAVATPGELAGLLPQADVVILAAALTPATRGMIGAGEFLAMKPGAVLVNVGRGGLVDTDALTDALRAGHVGSAALDVTDPEPLPEGHPLWEEPNCLITPHSADTMEMIIPLYSRRISENVRRFVNGDELTGLVDRVAGY
ncbi:MAG: NAD(P)-dependent oxidoreductase [Arthrobacter sp.]